MDMYGAFVAALCLFFVITLFYRGVCPKSGSSGPMFASFQRKFLAVYLIMMAADWMQGPYVYKLYSYYGFSRHDNGVLFIAGFGSSLLFGTWAGPFADKYGRKANCIAYGIMYTLSCCTKHFPIYGVLMIGRLLGGIATSILWSAFESWMVSEHLHRGFEADWIGGTFSMMITFNGIVAILAGFIAQGAADQFAHPVAPFDVSALFLIVGTLVIFFSWTENYGDTKSNAMGQMGEALHWLKTDRKILLVGAQQALFEGAMYTFVFMWTPTLEVNGAKIPHGLIFAAFMVSCSLGGTYFGIFSERMELAKLMRWLYVIAAISMVVPIMTSDPFYIMSAFVAFEIVVGMFWPGIGTLRSKYLPESCRATLINLFRVPLNGMVCTVLYFQGGMTVNQVFTICTSFHAVAILVALLLEYELSKKPKEPAVNDDSGTEMETK